MIARHGAARRFHSSFGRRGCSSARPASESASRADDVQLFALTFVGGFLFMSVYLA